MESESLHLFVLFYSFKKRFEVKWQNLLKLLVSILVSVMFFSLGKIISLRTYKHLRHLKSKQSKSKNCSQTALMSARLALQNTALDGKLQISLNREACSGAPVFYQHR